MTLSLSSLVDWWFSSSKVAVTSVRNVQWVMLQCCWWLQVDNVRTSENISVRRAHRTTIITLLCFLCHFRGSLERHDIVKLWVLSVGLTLHLVCVVLLWLGEFMEMARRGNLLSFYVLQTKQTFIINISFIWCVTINFMVFGYLIIWGVRLKMTKLSESWKTHVNARCKGSQNSLLIWHIWHNHPGADPCSRETFMR